MSGELVEILPPTLVPLGLILAGFLALVGYRRSKRLCPEEIGLIPIYQEQTGARFDIVNYTIPFIRVSVYPDFTVISYWRRQIVLRRGQVKGIEQKSYFLYRGIEIQHTRDDIPRHILIWPRNRKKLKEALESSLL